MKTVRIHSTLSDSLVSRLDEYGLKKNVRNRSAVISELLMIALDNYELLEETKDIKSINIKQLGYLKTIEDLNKILISALDIRSYKSPSENPVIQQYFKNKKDGTND